MREMPFTRPTIVAAAAMVGRHNQAAFDAMVLRLALENEVPDGPGLSVPKKCNIVARIVLQRAGEVIQTVDGKVTLAEVIVREAVALFNPHFVSSDQEAFLRGLARDGYVVEAGEGRNPHRLRVALPEEIALPEADDEVRQLLRQNGFAVPAGHLDQAIEAHTRGDWAAANAQLRTFVESLFDAIAFAIDANAAASAGSAENRRQLLGTKGFLAADRGEWSPDGKNFVNGLFKMLHTHGSHPGLSDEDHSTFRLHLVLVTSRTFLRRFTYGQ